jgi:hypothetical protein
VTVLRELVTMLGFEVDDAELNRWNDSAVRASQRVRDSMAAFGAVAVGATVAVTQSLINMGDELGDASARLGVSAQDLAEWDHVATMSGASTDALRGALGRMPRIIDQVSSGNRAMRGTFRELGVEVRGADGQLRSAGDVMQDVIGGLSRVRNPTLRAAMAARVFGRSGRELVGVLAQGEDGVARLRGEVRDLYGDDLQGFVAAAGQADDAQNRLTLQFRALGVIVGAEVLPVVAGLLEWAVSTGRAFIASAREFVHGTSIMRAGFIALAGGVTLAAIAFAAANVEMLPVIAVLGLVAAAVVGAALAIDDLWSMLEGGKSFLGETLGELLGAEEANALIRSLQKTWHRFQADIAALTGTEIPGAGSAMRTLLQGWILQMGVALGGIGWLIAGWVHLARITVDGAREMGTSIANAWTYGIAMFDNYRKRVLDGIASIRAGISAVSGFFGVDVSGNGRNSAGSVATSPAARAVVQSISGGQSSRSVSVGDIIVQGVTDPAAAAEAVRSHLTSFFADQVDIARDGLVPEAP